MEQVWGPLLKQIIKIKGNFNLENEKLEDIKNIDGGVKRGVKGQWVFSRPEITRQAIPSLCTLLEMLNIRHVYLLKGQARQRRCESF